MGLPPVTIEGRVGSDPVLRFIPSGAAVADFSIAVTERKKQGDEWVDGQTDWYRVSAWRALAENVSESVHRGDLVVVSGTLKQGTYEKDGQTRTSLDITADWVAASLRFNTVTVNRTQRQQGAPQGQQQAPQGQAQQPAQGQQQGGWQQPGGWNPNAGQQPAQGQQQDPWATPSYDEPPF